MMKKNKRNLINGWKWADEEVPVITSNVLCKNGDGHYELAYYYNNQWHRPRKEADDVVMMWMYIPESYPMHIPQRKEKMKEKTCEWKVRNGFEGIYYLTDCETECGEGIIADIEDFKFCPYCGGHIVIEKEVEK